MVITLTESLHSKHNYAQLFFLCSCVSGEVTVTSNGTASGTGLSTDRGLKFTKLCLVPTEKRFTL